MRAAFALVLGLFTLEGCGGPAVDAQPKPATPPVAAAPPAATPAVASTGAAAASAPAPNPVREAAQKVLACRWIDEEPDWKCEAWAAWQNLEARRGGAHDETLVAMLGEADPHLVYLGAHGLDHDGEKYRTDKALAEKVLVKLEGPVAAPTQQALAGAVGAIDVASTGLGERMLAVSKTLPTDARVAFVRAAQFRNSAYFYETTAALAKDGPDEKLREAAIRSFWTGTPDDKGEEVCELWTAIAEDPKTPDRLAGFSADFAAWSPMTPCVKQFDRLIARVEALIKSGSLKGWDWPSAMEHLALNEKASPAQKKKATALLVAMATGAKHDLSTRSTAATALTRVDPDAAKKLAAKLAKDKDQEVQKLAKDIETELKAAGGGK